MMRGLITRFLSPLNDDLSLDQPRLNDLEDLLSSGCAGLKPFETTGEPKSISTEERKRRIDGLIASEVDPSVITSGTGLCDPPEQAALSQQAVDLGCDGYWCYHLFI